MIYHENGRLGKLSVIGLGCWNFGSQWNNKVSTKEAVRIIRYAIDNGISFVEVAETYGEHEGQCEQILGKALQDGYRDKVLLISKVNWFGLMRMDVFTAKKSLYSRISRHVFNKINRFKPAVDLANRTQEFVHFCAQSTCGRLKTDHIDLLLCHGDTHKDLKDFIESLRQLKAEGYIKHYGISTDTLDVLKRFYELSDGECAACECDYSILNRKAETGIFRYCQENGIAIFTRGTLCRGILSGKYNLETNFKESSRSSWNIGGKNRWEYELFISRIEELNNKISGDSLADIAYKFAFSRPEYPCVLIGCKSLEQIKHNISIAEAKLSKDEVAIIESISDDLRGRNRESSPSILLLGGTGTLSSAVLQRALKKGYNLAVLNRGSKNNEIPIGVETIFGDLREPQEIERLLKNKRYDVVVDFVTRKPEEMECIFPVFSRICKQYIFISTACVYRRDKKDFPIQESSPKPNMNWAYNTEKYACENKLIELSANTSTWYTIIRPYITYDNQRVPFGVAPEYRYHRTLIERIKHGKPMFMWDDGKTITTSTYVSEFAVGVVGLFLNSKAKNEDFHITSSHTYKTDELLKQLYHKLGSNPYIVYYTEEELVDALPQYKNMLVGDRFLPAIFDNTKIKEAVPEYKSEITLEEGIDYILEYYGNNKEYAYDYQYEGVVDRLLKKKGHGCVYVSYPHSNGKDRMMYYLYKYFSYPVANKIKNFFGA